MFNLLVWVYKIGGNPRVGSGPRPAQMRETLRSPVCVWQDDTLTKMLSKGLKPLVVESFVRTAIPTENPQDR